MPLLTTLLLKSSEISLEENMKRFQKILAMNSLSTDETFVKNALKDGNMHRKAIDIVQKAMRMLMEADPETSLREANIEQFLQQCNYELMCSDPGFAQTMGIRAGGQDNEPGLGLTPEELAEQEL